MTLPYVPRQEAGNMLLAGETPQEKLLVWAVDGLAGVVLGGMPVGTGRGRPLRTPRAVLWGQHSGQLTWAGWFLT